MDLVVQETALKCPNTRDIIQGVEVAMKQAGCPVDDDAYKLDGCGLHHHFGDGLYVRETHLGKGTLLTSKIHKKSHPAFILKGRCKVLTEEGEEEICAPYYTMTKAGTKRLIYVLEDTIWITVHPAKSRDLSEIEDDVIAKDFEEFTETQIDNIKSVESQAEDFIKYLSEEEK